MLNATDNERITQTSAGTSGGNLLRRYWQPVALSEELNDDTPLAVEILGEELVLFRNGEGEPALIDRYCPHRRVDLSYGRVEDGGLRCLYHGWVMGGDGGCLEQPGEPETSEYRKRIRSVAYPCIEVGQIIFAYMGEGEVPSMPQFDYFNDDPSTYFVTKQFHECNYLQAMEGYVDPQHLSFLHRFSSESSLDKETNSWLIADTAPQMDVDETEFGFRIYTIRNTPDATKYIRITNFIMPNCGAFAGDPVVDPAKGHGEGYSINWAVPLNDRAHFKYVVNYRTDGPIDMEFMERSFQDIDKSANYTSPRDVSNRFMQDRGSMDRVFTGLGHNFFDHDKYAVESMGEVVDRTKEHLGTTDRPITLMRRQILAGIDSVENGETPPFWTLDKGRNMLATMVVKAETIPVEADPRTLVPEEA